MKEKLKELLSIPTKTWKEERLISYLINHFEEKGYNYETHPFEKEAKRAEKKWKRYLKFI